MLPVFVVPNMEKRRERNANNKTFADEAKAELVLFQQTCQEKSKVCDVVFNAFACIICPTKSPSLKK